MSVSSVGASVFAWMFPHARDSGNECKVTQKADGVSQVVRRFGAKG